MNKKQLIVTLVTAISIYLSFLSMPLIDFFGAKGERLRECVRIQRNIWYLHHVYIPLVILIIAGILIYALRDKHKQS